MKLRTGERAPDFELSDANGTMWSLANLRGKKVILYFYPADDTAGCTAQACDFRDARAELDASGYTVLGVSPQGADSHRRFSEKYGLNFPLLIDSDLEVARKFGAVNEDGDRVRVRRSTFVIDEDGRIERALYGVKARGHVAGLREKLRV